MEAITSEGKRRKGKEKGEKEIKIFGYSLHKKKNHCWQAKQARLSTVNMDVSNLYKV